MILNGSELPAAIRTLCESARKRVWLAVPFIGGNSVVRRVLGRRWLDDPKLEVRLLVDISQRDALNRESLDMFARNGKVRSLAGLHAKVFIGDHEAIIGSANLTYTSLKMRFEAGIRVTGADYEELIGLYETWWIHPDGVDVDTAMVAALPDPGKRTHGEQDEPCGSGLKVRWALAEDPGGGDGWRARTTFILRADWEQFSGEVRRGLEGSDVGWTHVLDVAHRTHRLNLPWESTMFADDDVRAMLLGIRNYGNFGHVGASGRIRHILATGTRRQLRTIVSAINDIGVMHHPVDGGELARHLRRLCDLGPTMTVWGRFLLLARPDLYFTVSNPRLRAHLGRELGLEPDDLKAVDGYVRAVALLHNTPWFKSDRPAAEKTGRDIWDRRCAYIDVLLRDDEYYDTIS